MFLTYSNVEPPKRLARSACTLLAPGTDLRSNIALGAKADISMQRPEGAAIRDPVTGEVVAQPNTSLPANLLSTLNSFPALSEMSDATQVCLRHPFASIYERENVQGPVYSLSSC